MKIITRAVLDMATMQWIPALEESFEYSGEIAKCDRAAQAAAKNLRNTTAADAAQAGSMAQSTESQLNPFFQREMNAEHYFTPGQADELLTAAGAQAGGIAGTEAEALRRNAVSTGNPTALTKNLQELARDRMKANAGAAENVAAQDVMGAKQLNQMGAAGEGHLFDVNTDAQLKAMGLENQAINTEVEAGKSGWLQNLNSTLGTLSKLGNPFKP